MQVMNSRIRQAFTLIELLVVIMIIAILIALLLPAMQSAREAARRAQCVNNLKQIGLACHQYHDVNNCLPLGFIGSNDSRQLIRNRCSGEEDQSWLVRILPFIEQKPLYDSINQQTWISSYENWTSISVMVNSYICPSAPDGGQILPMIPALLKNSGFPVTGAPPVSYATSYAALSGTTEVYTGPMPEYNCLVPQTLLQVFNGLMSWQTIQFQNITDGLSSTIMAGDRSIRASNGPTGKVYFGIWFQARFSFTIGTTMQTPNYFNGIKSDSAEFKPAYALIPNNLSSYHPGGVNVLFCDGSVRFIKSSVQSWPVDSATSLPAGATQDDTLYYYTNLPKPGVWQALSTRAGGEVINAGDY